MEKIEKTEKMQRLLAQFDLEGGVIHLAKFGNGHINDTYLLVTDKPHLYILQKLNSYVFKNAHTVMHNIVQVTNYLKKTISDPRYVLTLLPTKKGDWYILDENNECWRVYEYVTDSLCLDAARNEEDFKQSGVAFGRFQNDLAAFPAETLYETIVQFHDTPHRFAQLKQAIKEDRAGRAKIVEKEIAFYLSREKEASVLMDMLHNNELPLRVTLNDTKLNNVMLDRQSGKPLCVIDLDTIMPGLVANDFGDSIRFGASTGAEDERDLTKVSLSLSLFKAFTEGFLSACGKRLTPKELYSLPIGAKMMTLECGTRFLADYLNGDVYFHVDRESHNLDRARTQMKLVADMENKWTTLYEIVNQYQ